MDNYNQFLSVLVLAAGVYIVYEYVKMLKTGHISEILLLGKGTPESRCKDREAYTKRAYPAVLVLAIVTMAYGIVDFLNFFVVSMAMVDLVFLVIFLIVLFGYMIYTSKLKKKYFRPY